MDLDGPVAWQKSLSEQTELMKREMPMAMSNLIIAQHRDRTRFVHTRSGSYIPKVRKMEKGEYVYLKRQTTNSKLME